MSTQTSNTGYSTIIHIIPVVLAMVGTPVLGLVAAFIMWIFKKEECTYIDHHGREAVRFQLMMALYGIATVFLMLIFPPLMLLVWPLGIIFAVINIAYPCYMAYQAYNGNKDTYAFVFSPRR